LLAHDSCFVPLRLLRRIVYYFRVAVTSPFGGVAASPPGHTGHNSILVLRLVLPGHSAAVIEDMVRTLLTTRPVLGGEYVASQHAPCSMQARYCKKLFRNCSKICLNDLAWLVDMLTQTHVHSTTFFTNKLERNYREIGGAIFTSAGKTLINSAQRWVYACMCVYV
jgi:hypothetical protein